MSYGVEILNNNDRIVIDLNYANFGFVSDTLSTATPGTAYPGLAGSVTSDLVIARANTTSDGVIAKTVTGTWANTQGGAASITRYYVIRRFDSLNPASSSGYGFAVYNTSSNVIFTSNIAKNFEIVTAGTFNSSISGVANIAFPSATTWYSNFDKYYCAINSTVSFTFLVSGSLSNYKVGYTYLWANSTHGRILVESNLKQGTSPIQTLNRDFHYMILRELT
jgi:hypothetical protein